MKTIFRSNFYSWIKLELLTAELIHIDCENCLISERLSDENQQNLLSKVKKFEDQHSMCKSKKFFLC